MGIQDIIKKSFLSQFNSDLSTTNILMTLFIAAMIGVYIFFVYRVVCRKAFYSKSFAISLTVIAMITAAIIITIQSNAVISLGMVGALSIVRFRTAVKDPMDLAFLFWSISVGIICGATLYEVALEVSALITVIMLLLHLVPNAKPTLLLILNSTDSKVQSQLETVLKEHTIHYKIKSRTISRGNLDMVVEVSPKNDEILVESVLAIPTITQASLITHDGEVTA